MKDFITITIASNNRELDINPKFVSSIEHTDYGARIVMSNSSVFNVKETREEVRQMIEEYK